MKARALSVGKIRARAGRRLEGTGACTNARTDLLAPPCFPEQSKAVELPCGVSFLL